MTEPEVEKYFQQFADFFPGFQAAASAHGVPLEEYLQQSFQNATVTKLTVGSIMLNFVTNECLVRGNPIDLTSGEWAIMVALMRNAGLTVTTAELMQVSGISASSCSSCLAGRIKRLRRKIRDPAIVTVWGGGYRLDRQILDSPQDASE